MINCPAMPDRGDHSCVMWVVCSLTLFTTFQIVFGTIFWIFITQKGNLPVCEGFPLVFNNQKAQAKIIQSWIHFGLVQNLRVTVFFFFLFFFRKGYSGIVAKLWAFNILWLCCCLVTFFWCWPWAITQKCASLPLLTGHCQNVWLISWLTIMN